VDLRPDRRQSCILRAAPAGPSSRSSIRARGAGHHLKSSDPSCYRSGGTPASTPGHSARCRTSGSEIKRMFPSQRHPPGTIASAATTDNGARFRALCRTTRDRPRARGVTDGHQQSRTDRHHHSAGARNVLRCGNITAGRHGSDKTMACCRGRIHPAGRLPSRHTLIHSFPPRLARAAEFSHPARINSDERVGTII
jgi:hypothetical protein